MNNNTKYVPEEKLKKVWQWCKSKIDRYDKSISVAIIDGMTGRVIEHKRYKNMPKGLRCCIYHKNIFFSKVF